MCRCRSISSTASSSRGRSNPSTSTSCCSRTPSRRWCTNTRFPRWSRRVRSPFRLSIRKSPERSRAVLVSLDIGRPVVSDRAEEAARLVESAGAEVVSVVRGRRDRPDAATFVGSGKVDEIKRTLLEQRSNTVVFDRALSAAQVRNLERALSEGNSEIRVFDRTDVILDIFAQRARSHEGKLQVELARLEHLSTRLVRGWTHLERQRGSLGKTGGPGEKQIELDRRMIGEQVKKLKERIKKVGRVRATQRARRVRSGILRVSIVGYIRDLPHTLVGAFRATLEETIEADLLLHVVDVASETRDEQVKSVNAVLKEIGAADVPQLLILNQIDRVPGMKPEVVRDASGK